MTIDMQNLLCLNMMIIVSIFTIIIIILIITIVIIVVTLMDLNGMGRMISRTGGGRLV